MPFLSIYIIRKETFIGRTKVFFLLIYIASFRAFGKEILLTFSLLPLTFSLLKNPTSVGFFI